MFRSCVLVVMSLVVVACSNKDDKPPAPPPPPPPAVTDATAVDTGSGSAGSAAGSGSDAAGSGSAAAGSAAGSDAETVDFDKLSHDDKIKFMKTKVVPPMKAAFQKFDAKEYAKFGCKTCHGKDPQKSKYKMPTPDLPVLDFDALKKGDDKEMAEFMANTVKPEMAKILGVHEMTQAEPTGFGCLACHTQKKKS